MFFYISFTLHTWSQILQHGWRKAGDKGACRQVGKSPTVSHTYTPTHTPEKISNFVGDPLLGLIKYVILDGVNNFLVFAFNEGNPSVKRQIFQIFFNTPQLTRLALIKTENLRVLSRGQKFCVLHVSTNNFQWISEYI